MRFLAPLLLTSLVSVTALADAAVTAVDDEPTSHDAARPAAPPTRAPAPSLRATERHAPSETGELRAARIAAPAPVAVDDGPSVTSEHAVAPAHEVASAATDGDVMAELAAKQMKRHQRALAGCTTAAHKRAPGLAGALMLDFEVADRKVKSVHVTDDGVHDFELARCLTTAARAFTFSLASARFRWPVALQP